MNQVTRKKLWKRFILFSLVCNILGMVFGVWAGSSWIAFGHAISAVVAVLIYLETFDKGPEDDYDEQ
jgi:hypothetical protein